MAKTIKWPGKSGTQYKYWIYDVGSEFTNEGGNYIWAKETRPGHFKPIYIGQTKALQDRFDNHHKFECAKRNGATHVHAHLNSSSEKRLAEETDLIEKWNPVCND